MAVGPALTEVLRAERQRFNALAAEARLLGGGFAEEPMMTTLAGPVDALATAVAAVDAAAVATVVEEAYRAALTLTSRGLLRAEATAPLEGLWRLLPRMAAQVAAAPRRVIASLSNAAVAVGAHGRAAQGGPAAERGAWAKRVAGVADALGSHGDPAALLDAVRVAAWSMGLAQHRGPAIDAADRLSPALLAAALGVGEVAEDTAARLRRHRWWRPDRRSPPTGLVDGERVGGFRGFGGPWLVVPEVWRDSDGRLLAGTPDAGTWMLHADAFGSVLLRARGSAAREGPPTSRPDPREEGWAIPADVGPVASAAATTDTLALATRTSLRVRVVGRLS